MDSVHVVGSRVAASGGESLGGESLVRGEPARASSSIVCDFIVRVDKATSVDDHHGHEDAELQFVHEPETRDNVRHGRVLHPEPWRRQLGNVGPVAWIHPLCDFEDAADVDDAMVEQGADSRHVDVEKCPVTGDGGAGDDHEPAL